MPALLRPMAPTAPTAILCGDPARALAIAQHLLVEPRMSNHHRGLWGYHGSTAAGSELTVQATGIGGPGAALVLSELAGRGLEAAIRVGTARSPEGGPELGALTVAEAAIAGDGTSAAYGAQPGCSLAPDQELTRALAGDVAELVVVQSRDRLPAADRAEARSAGHAPDVLDMQSAALLAAAERLGVRLAIGLVISRDPGGPLEDDPLEAASLRLAALAAAALAGGWPGAVGSGSSRGQG